MNNSNKSALLIIHKFKGNFIVLQCSLCVGGQPQQKKKKAFSSVKAWKFRNTVKNSKMHIKIINCRNM